MNPALKRGRVVYDSWWPWRVGSITKRNKSSVYVQWSDGKTWRYDRAHTQFLRTR
jgi:hypothetical protein